MGGCVGWNVVRLEAVGGEAVAVLFLEVFSGVVVHTLAGLCPSELQAFSWSKHHDDVCFIHGVGTSRYAMLCHETWLTVSPHYTCYQLPYDLVVRCSPILPFIFRVSGPTPLAL